MKIKKCCICGREIYGFGNNPYPVKDEGECCDICNLQRVIPERILLMKDKEKISRIKKQLETEGIKKVAKKITDKLYNEIKLANNEKGIDGVNEVLKKYDLNDLMIEIEGE